MSEPTNKKKRGSRILLSIAFAAVFVAAAFAIIADDPSSVSSTDEDGYIGAPGPGIHSIPGDGTFNSLFAGAGNYVFNMTANVTCSTTLAVGNSFDVTIDLNGFDLKFEINSSDAINVSADGVLTINDTVGGGSLDFSFTGASNRGIYVNGGTVTVNSDIIADGNNCYAVSATDDADVTINGNIAVDGNVSMGVYAIYGAKVTVSGDVTVNVNLPSAQSSNTTGVYAYDNAEISVGGDVTVSGGSSIRGVSAYGNSIVNVNGNVVLHHSGICVYAESSKVTVDGIIDGPSVDVMLYNNGAESLYFSGNKPLDISTKPGYWEYKTSSETVWVKKSYEITYRPGDYGIGSISTVTKLYGADLELKGETYTRTGYVQTGWSLNSNGLPRIYELGVDYTANADVTLYPSWTAVYTITYHPGNHGSGSTSTAVKLHGTLLDLPGVMFTRENYLQTGWSMFPEGNESNLNLGGSFGGNASMSLYPFWTPYNPVTVTDGSGSDSYLKGAIVNITANEAPEGKLFDKWIVTSGDVTLADANSESTTFEMSGSPVTVTAMYRNVPSEGLSIVVIAAIAVAAIGAIGATVWFFFLRP
jgi:hypothetical protein